MSGTAYPINAYVETPWINLPKERGIPEWERVRVEGCWIEVYAGGEPNTVTASNSTISMTLSVMLDFNDTVHSSYSLTFDAAPYPQRTPVSKQLIKAIGNGRTFEWIKLKLENSNIYESFTIYRVVFGFTPKPMIER